MDQLYMFLSAIHTANRIANKIVPLASKPITQVRQSIRTPRHHASNRSATHFGGQSESPAGTRDVYGYHVDPHGSMAT